MHNRRVVCGSLSLGLALLAGFAPQGTGAVSSGEGRPAAIIHTGFAQDTVIGTDLVTTEGDDSTAVIPLRRHDADTCRTSYAFTDEHGDPTTPPAP